MKFVSSRFISNYSIVAILGNVGKHITALSMYLPKLVCPRVALVWERRHWEHGANVNVPTTSKPISCKRRLA